MIAETIGRIFFWVWAVFFACGAYGFFPRDQVESGTAAIITSLCVVGCIGSIVMSFHVFEGSKECR